MIPRCQHTGLGVSVRAVHVSICLSSQAAWNMSMIQTEDVVAAVQAVLTKDKPSFSKL